MPALSPDAPYDAALMQAVNADLIPTRNALVPRATKALPDGVTNVAPPPDMTGQDSPIDSFWPWNR
jgi:hypothetical protein